MLLSAELRSRLDRLSLSSRKRVRSAIGGRHASTRKGESLDFADYRPYVPGDDFRRIDHNLYARLGQLVVREFEAEEELALKIVLDFSTSMAFYGKADTARRLAGMVAYLGLVGGDRVSLFVIPGPDRPLIIGPSGRHVSAWPRLETWLESRVPGGSVPLAPVLRSLIGASASRGATILISDLLDSEWARALDGLALGAGGVVLHVLGREEIEPDLAGDLMLKDAESGEKSPVSTSEDTRRDYRKALETFVEDASGRTKRAGLDYILVPVADDVLERTMAALVRAEAVR